MNRTQKLPNIKNKRVNLIYKNYLIATYKQLCKSGGPFQDKANCVLSF